MGYPKYWLELWQSQECIEIDFGSDFHRRNLVAEALKDTNVTVGCYESEVDKEEE